MSDIRRAEIPVCPECFTVHDGAMCVGPVDGRHSPTAMELLEVVEYRHLQGAVKEVERLQRLIGDAYAARGPRSTQVLRSLYGQATRGGQS